MTEVFEHGYAAVIGVDKNQIQRLSLPTVAKDVQAIYDVLIHPQRCAYHPDNVKLVSGEEATEANILETLTWLREKVKADPEATAVVYYSGHGLFDRSGNQYYLIPYDIPSLDRVRSRAIKAETFTAEVADIQPKRMLVLLDCCHAAGVDAKDVELAAEAPNLAPISFPMELPETKAVPTYEEGGKDVHDLLEGEGRAILNSSTGAESSYIRRDGRMSLFTYHLIEALTGHAPHDPEDATVLVTDVMSYVTRHVAETARTEGRQQTPVMRTSGVFPVALVLGGEGAKGVESLPDPLEPLPEVAGSTTTTFNQEGQTVGGHQVNIGRDATIDRIGDDVNTGGGAFIRGNVNTGGGDFTGRDRVSHGDEVAGDQIRVGDVSGQGVAIGRGARASVGSQGEGERQRPPQPERQQQPAVEQGRRLEAAMPETTYVDQTTELLVMVSLLDSLGLRRLLPRETEAGDIIGADDVTEAPATVRFPDKTQPVTLTLEVRASPRDFEIEDPQRTIEVYPDQDSNDETFYLYPLRRSRRAPVTVRLLNEEERLLSTVRLTVTIEGDEEMAGGEALGRQLEEAIRYAVAQAGVVVNYTQIGNISDSSNLAIGRDASANMG